MALHVTATANVSTYEANPQRISSMTFETTVISNQFWSLDITTHRTTGKNISVSKRNMEMKEVVAQVVTQEF
jgi:hypothetical protein